MKLLSILSFVLAANVMAADISCKVVGVSDGDTLTCLAAGNQSIKVRLAQIDAPEKNQPFGEKSKQALSAMVFGKQVVLQPETRDRYGRTVAKVFVGDLDVNRQQLRKGMAWVYRQYSRDSGYDGAEAFAKSYGTGLWADPNPVAPWVWRHEKRQAPAASAPSRPIALPAPSAPASSVPDPILMPRRSAAGFSCSGKVHCSEMVSCEEAKYYLRYCPNVKIDGDHDGVPCEKMCR